MYELKTNYDIDFYTPETRQAIQTHRTRIIELQAMVSAIRHLEEAETQLAKAGIYDHCESVERTADKLDLVQLEARQLIVSTGNEVQQEIWREDYAIENMIPLSVITAQRECAA